MTGAGSFVVRPTGVWLRCTVSGMDWDQFVAAMRGLGYLVANATLDGTIGVPDELALPGPWMHQLGSGASASHGTPDVAGAGLYL
jgi:hypothetical protein